jgi:hypothetical protein
LRSLIRMLQDLSIYYLIFEGPLLESTTHFYSQVARTFVNHVQFSVAEGPASASEVAQYVTSFYSHLQAESSRCDPLQGYLDLSTRKRIIMVLDHELIENHVEFLLGKGRSLFYRA